MQSADLFELVTGQPEDEPRPQFPGIYKGEVIRADMDALHFKIRDYSDQIEFGPCDYPRIPAATQPFTCTTHHAHGILAAVSPPAGTECAVAFSDGDPGKPLVLTLYGWPA